MQSQVIVRYVALAIIAVMSKRRQERGRTGRRPNHHDPQQLTVHPGPMPGPGVVSATVDEVLEALRGFDPAGPWVDVAPVIMPMFERRRPFPPGSPDAISVVLPPGVSVGFGVDLGPALARVGPDLLETWGIDERELVATALANVRRRAFAVARPRTVREAVAGVPVVAFQSRDGWASALLLVPDALEHILGRVPRLITAPMRDLLLAFPLEVDRDLACELTEDIESLDPNALALEAFAWQDGRLACRPMRQAASA